MGKPAHAVVDWGTSSFRLWTLSRDGEVLGERRSAEGLKTAGAHGGFEAVLETHLAALGVPDGVPVMMCGMVGSRTGWLEADYLAAPVRLPAIAGQVTRVPAARRPVCVLPGIAQRDRRHPDVMRGEETQLLALAGTWPNGIACMPGTHSKWVELRDGTVERFATYLTGEMFQLLRTSSVVAPAVEGVERVAPESAAFTDGVAAALAAPEQAGNLLFELRANWLLAGAVPGDTLARLSGLLIGFELAAAERRFGPLAGVALIAAEPTASLYHRALDIAGVTGLALYDAETLVREGLHAAAAAAFEPAGLPR
jgi:2-dehydro-3-deoxygalactonokinase